MKTAVIVERDLNGLAVRQNSKTEMFNANDLLDIYNESTKSHKKIDAYLANTSTKEFINVLTKDVVLNTQDSGELEREIMQTKRGRYGGTWMHPYLFIHFAMWLSPEFNLMCIKWIHDNLIRTRNECGDTFKTVNDALYIQEGGGNPFMYANEAKMINKLVFGSADKGQRNLATEEELQLLKNLQKMDIKLIQKGLDFYERYEKLKELRSYVSGL